MIKAREIVEEYEAYRALKFLRRTSSEIIIEQLGQSGATGMGSQLRRRITELMGEALLHIVNEEIDALKARCAEMGVTVE
jgi:hypothetical protein